MKGIYLKTIKTFSSEETIELGKKIGSLLKPGDVIALEGTLAAGKTTFTKGIAQALLIDEAITSPTFTVISEYEGKMPLFHFDTYRLADVDDFINLGIDDMLYGDGVCVIEWSEKVKDELPKNTITIKLTAQDDGSRIITIANWPYGELD